MAGTLNVAAVLRAGKAGTLNDLFAAHGIGASSAPAPTPTPLPPAMVAAMPDTRELPTPAPMLNANRNVIPADAAPAGGGGASLSLAPAPAAPMTAAPDWRAWLKKWWPWILVALLAVVVMARVARPSGRRSSGASE